MPDYTQATSPCFVLDEKRLRRNMEILNNIQERTGVKIICALKGYSFWRSFPIIAEYLPGATASSLNEARLAKEEMGKEVHVFAPAYEDGEIDEILKYADHAYFPKRFRYSQNHRSRRFRRPIPRRSQRRFR